MLADAGARLHTVIAPHRNTVHHRTRALCGRAYAIVAVGRYSGENLQETLQFDLRVTHLPAAMPCPW
jgi:hypothetical protein